jgi:hypothetical protein
MATRNFYRFLLPKLLILLLLTGCSQGAPIPEIEAQMNKQTNILPITTGTFTQPQAVDLYTPEDWELEFASMQQAGISLWIYQWVGDSKNKTTIYPTKLPGYNQTSNADQVEIALSMAQKYGMQVFLGLVFNEDWWGKEGSDLEWLQNEAAQMNAVADELYATYFPRYPKTFAGWYINWEMDNYAGYNRRARQRENIITALQIVSGHLDELNPSLPSSIAPFFNTAGGSSAQDYGRLWYEVMSKTSVDILMLQDGIGVDHTTLEQLPEWYQQVCAGVRAAGKACWSDLENFATGPDGNLYSAPVDRVIQQHQIAAQYVGRIVTFSFISYMSPVDLEHTPYYQNYMKYVDGLSESKDTP